MHRLAEAAAAKLTARLAAQYPELALLPEPLLGPVLSRHALALRIPAGTTLFEEGQGFQGFPLLLSGELRVARGSAQGRSLEIYRLTPGGMCAASAACLFNQGTYPAHGTALQDCELLLVDAAGVDLWMQHRPFRQELLALLTHRLGELLALAEAVAFQRLDQRLAGMLLGQGPVVRATHQGMADELGTAREIVTRLLKRFEREGWVQVSRQRVEILDTRALHQMATTGSA
jgi:CRP/FNR family transcriptional regulator